MVERFRREFFEMKPNENGSWVNYSDYAALEAQLAEKNRSTLEATPPAPKVMDEWERIAGVIADNLPSPYALDDVWRQTETGAEFDLTRASDSTKEEWRGLVEALTAAQEAGKP